MLSPGVYEKLLDEELSDLLGSSPDLVATLEKLDDEESSQAYSQFVAQILRQVLPAFKPEDRIPLINRLIELIGSPDGFEYTLRKRLISTSKSLLRQVRPIFHQSLFPQPATPLSVSSLFTGSGDDPQLEREIRTEMRTSDRLDILVAFIRWSGLALLMSAFEELEGRGVPVRIITTSYMGASDPRAVEWLAERKNVKIRVSYDTKRTRLHAKAYHFVRSNGYSTAYIGSANMTNPAMTSGLEWTVKVTAQDMPHILERFEAEFETYWQQDEFIPFDRDQPQKFREAIVGERNGRDGLIPTFFFDICPRPFQERILEALEAERLANHFRNLVVAATGTGKTVVSAFDYARFRKQKGENAKLLFVAHRKEILHQALECFRCVLREPNFGELFVDGLQPTYWTHVFASIQSISAGGLWTRCSSEYFQYVVVDEVHHGTASSYRPIFERIRPEVLLGLTATPERMDGSSVLPDFGNRFAAEIRLPEALGEKLLCPFHYFGVTDPLSTADERFWRRGKYSTEALEQVYTGDDLRATERLNAILGAISRYCINFKTVRAVGFCAGRKHAEYMARKFCDKGIRASTILGNTSGEERAERLRDFREGRLQFLFVVDIFSEGIDIPEIDLVLFLRPTESLTVFLQQLGRGLRHAPEKECLTVLDFVGQCHRRYRVDRKFSALLKSSRWSIDKEVELEFPSLPPGCSIQLERVAREHVLENIRSTLGSLQSFIPETIRTFQVETGQPLTFANFIEYTGLSPSEFLRNRTWSEWKDAAGGICTVADPDVEKIRRTLCRIASRTDPYLLQKAKEVSLSSVAEDPEDYGMSEKEATALHYLLWSESGMKMGANSHRESFARWLRNASSAADLVEIVEWRSQIHSFPVRKAQLPISCSLHLHAAYGLREITSLFGKATLETIGVTGVGVVHVEELKVYIHLVTFRKQDHQFAPTTRYKDYPTSPTLLHWESQAGITQASPTGQNYIHFKERGYSILFFARLDKSLNGVATPFIFLGPAKDLQSHQSDRPIRMVWELEYAMPAELFEGASAIS